MKIIQTLTLIATVAIATVSSVYANDSIASASILPPPPSAYADSGMISAGSGSFDNRRHFGLQNHYGSGSDINGSTFTAASYNSGTLDGSGSSHTRKPSTQYVSVNYTLPASVNIALNARLATFSNTGSQVSWLQTVSVKITALLAQTTNSTQLQNVLQALQQLIQTKITHLSGGTEDDNSSITNLFN